MLTIIDVWNRECIRIEVDHPLTDARVARAGEIAIALVSLGLAMAPSFGAAKLRSLTTLLFG